MPFNPEKFPRGERLRSAREFQSVYAGKRVSGNSFIIYYSYACSGRKMGLTVSKKVSKSAVVRNKLKRRIREIYRLNKNILPDNVSLIIRSMPQAAGVDFNELKVEIIQLFNKISAKATGNRADKGI